MQNQYEAMRNDLVVDKYFGVSFTEYKISGPAAAVDTEIDRIFGEYNPRGYGTTLKSSVEKMGLKYAIVWRSNSCD